jgi:hypothetical protein
MRGLALALWVAVMVLPVGATAAPWETTRQGVIDPPNEIDWPAGHRTVHGPLPADHRHGILEE